MSRIISHQPGLGTPDEVLGDGDGTDDGVGEKRVRGMGLAEIGAQKNTVAVYPRRLALPKPGFVASDLLTPQGKDLNPWYLKQSLTATAMLILTRSRS